MRYRAALPLFSLRWIQRGLRNPVVDVRGARERARGRDDAAGDRRQGLGRSGQGDWARVHLLQPRRQVPRHCDARPLVLGRHRVQFWHHRPLSHHGHASGLGGAAEPGRQRELLRLRHGVHQRHHVAGGGEPSARRRLLPHAHYVVQRREPARPLLPLDDGRVLSAREPIARVPGIGLHRARWRRALLACGLEGPRPLRLRQQRLRSI